MKTTRGNLYGGLQSFFVLIVLIALASCQNLPTTPAPTIPSTPEATLVSGSKLLNNSDGSLDALKGIAKFDGASNCTGAFIQTSERGDAPAYLITNGHCAQDWNPNEIFRDMSAEGYTATFNYFIDTQDAQIAIPAKTIAYSTMKGRDVAIIELDATIGELTAQGIQPFAIADATPASTNISVFGVPVTGLPPDEWYLRREDCLMIGQVDLLEFQWHFFDSFRNTCKDIFGGSSGSPVFAQDSDAILALINTTTVGGEYACALGAPCEVTNNRIYLSPNTSYATPIIGISHCFDAEGRFNLDLSTCPLDDGLQLSLEGQPLSPTQPIVTDENGVAQRVTWNTALFGDFTYYRYKIGAVSSVDCRDADGYSDPIELRNNNLIEDEIPEAEGFYYLCIVAGNNSTVDSTWQSFANATVIFAQIDTTPPVIPPTLSVQELETEYLVEPVFKIPELAHYILKFGPPEETDCKDMTGYVPYRRIAIPIEKGSQTPAKVCVIGYDYANNPTPPLEQIIGSEP